MANINIFYSWQSDLPGAETRNFIQSCIDAAVKTLKDTVYVEYKNYHLIRMSF